MPRREAKDPARTAPRSISHRWGRTPRVARDPSPRATSMAVRARGSGFHTATFKTVPAAAQCLAAAAHHRSVSVANDSQLQRHRRVRHRESKLAQLALEARMQRLIDLRPNIGHPAAGVVLYGHVEVPGTADVRRAVRQT